jgi:hypothetical protein
MKEAASKVLQTFETVSFLSLIFIPAMLFPICREICLYHNLPVKEIFEAEIWLFRKMFVILPHK